MPLPHGGKLIKRVAAENRRNRLLTEAEGMTKLTLSSELAWETANISHGLFSPLEGFMLQEDYLNVLQDKRLSNDIPWTIPIILDVDDRRNISEGETIILQEKERSIATLKVEEVYEFDKKLLTKQVFRTLDSKHPGVNKAMRMKKRLVGGKIELLNDPQNRYQKYTLKPLETRVLFNEKRWRTIVGFQTRNVPHLGHEYVQKTALTFVDGLFINPVIGRKKLGDFKDAVILKTYEALIRNYYLKDHAVMAIFHTEMRYAGPREAIFHAIVRKNFGCTHFIVGRDHAGVGDYYPPYAAQEIFNEFPDLGITPLFFKSFFHCKKCNSIVNEKTCPHPIEEHIHFRGTRIREMINQGETPPKTIMRPEVVGIIKRHKNPFIEANDIEKN